MKLLELHNPIILEGGHVFKDAQGEPLTTRIHQTDVAPTLDLLHHITGLPTHDHVLGSVGKKVTSGDIDIAVDSNEITKDELVHKLQSWAEESGYDAKSHVKKSGISVHFLTPIANDPLKGWTQVDFMFHPDIKWMKFSMHSAGDASKYTGADRNLLMSSIAKAQGLKYSWQKGLLRRSDETVISTDPDQIAQKLLGAKYDHSVFNSVEQMQEVIHKNNKLMNALNTLINDLESDQDPHGSPRKPGVVRKNQEEAQRIRRLTHIN
jgi:hypothetical protein